MSVAGSDIIIITSSECLSAPQVFSLLIKPFNDSSAKGKRNCRNPQIVKTRAVLRQTNINPIQKLSAQNSSII